MRAAEPALAPAAAAPDRSAARSLAAMARAGLEARHPDEAAVLFDRAFEVDPHPVWQVAAGTAWLEALEPEQASERLAAALADPALGDGSRERAAQQLDLARRLTPVVARARKAEAEHAPAAAARAWDEAFRIMPVGASLVRAARAAELAGRAREAARLFTAANDRSDLSSEDQRVVADAIDRLRHLPPPARPAASAAPWWFVGSGGAVALGGLVAVAVGEGYRSDLQAIKDTAVDGVVTGTTRRDAAVVQQRAEAWSTAGWIALGAGVTAAALGAGWLVGREPASRGSVRVEAAVGPSGWGLSASAAF
ncbi:MAG: hypothetical protein U1F43_29620 [Myxococcota bacterium]